MEPHEITKEDIKRAHNITRRYATRTFGKIDYDEIYSAACYGLVCASRTFHQSRGHWIAWSVVQMRREICDVFERAMCKKRGPNAKHLSYGQPRNKEEANTVVDIGVEDFHFDPKVKAIIAQFSERTKDILFMSFLPHGIKEASKRYGISHQRASNIAKAAINKIQESLEISIDTSLSLTSNDRSMPKLYADQPEQIKYLYATGNFSYRELATAYGISYQTIMEIIKGEAYRSAA